MNGFGCLLATGESHLNGNSVGLCIVHHIPQILRDLIQMRGHAAAKLEIWVMHAELAASTG
jgi:hypothetical protein